METTARDASQADGRWRAAIAGLGLAIAALVGLCGPGRIDIVDGQTRYEVARSLHDHGDLEIRDPRVTFAVFPGRDGKRYTTYRLPQSLLGVGAIVVSDATGPTSEVRRRFFFSLLGAFEAGLIAVLFAVAFRRRGMSRRAALGWAALGALATPVWFYATSTFDDEIGAAVLVGMFVVAERFAGSQRVAGALAVGLLAGLAFHAKPPLAVFLLPALARLAPPAWRRPGWLRSWLVGALACGALVALHFALERYLFPPSARALHPALIAKYVPTWLGDPFAAFSGWLMSPGAGFLWYCPPAALALAGFVRRSRSDRDYARAMFFAVAIYLAFLAKLTFWKGDPCWGPRYLTPLFAIGWLSVPEGSRSLGKLVASLLIAAGVVVQLLALAIDPHRLFVARDLHATYYAEDQFVYLHPEVSHLLARPGEIAAAWSERDRPAPRFSPAPDPTFAFPMLNDLQRGPATVERFTVLRTFRPWWWAMRELPPAERPVGLATTGLTLVACLAGALAALSWSARLGDP